jgi:F-type H+-transporting ATPase subunit delta
MAEVSTLARPYAQAIFSLAFTNNTFKTWSEQLTLLKEVTANKLMIEVISNPNISDVQIITLISDICSDGLDEQGINFLKLAAENGRLGIIPVIADSFEILRSEAEGSIEAEVISAYAINATQKKSIAAALKKELGREVTITSTIDKSLLAGVIIRAGDIVIDGSVKTQLERMTHSLLS